MIHDTRVQVLSDKPASDSRYVLYWMQASQRVECNHALEYAVRAANDLRLPLLVFFGLAKSYPEANLRHYSFMLQGLKEVARALADRGIAFVLRRQSPEVGAVELSRDAALLVADRGYTRIQRAWRAYAADRVACPVIQVESDVIVPAETASGKEAFAAADFRRNIGKSIPDYLVPLSTSAPEVSSLAVDIESLDASNPDALVEAMTLDRSVLPVEGLKGGASEARRLLEEFVNERLDGYDQKRNDPTVDYQSRLSPYLHFGQVSPLEVALRVLDSDSPGTDAYLEQLIVRRELAVNFVLYNPAYDSWDGLPAWARETLRAHERDAREEVYSSAELEGGRTDDPYWNAAQRQMVLTGKMHGYMRMYWGKRLIEWHDSAEEAFRVALYLNNRYEFDGRDPNGFAGVAWCFGKHDRPWPERAFFGNVRSMTASGLKRKFDADAYAAHFASSLPIAP